MAPKYQLQENQKSVNTMRMIRIFCRKSIHCIRKYEELLKKKKKKRIEKDEQIHS